MKSVGNLTDFVRDHMLEAFPVEARIDALIAHFDDLHRAHEAVLKAKRQIDQLTPLTADCDRHDALRQQVEQLRGCRDMLRPWFAHLKQALLGKRIDLLQGELDALSDRLTRQGEERRALAQRRDEITHAIAANGGNRIEQIKGDISRLQSQREDRWRRCSQYDALATAVGLAAATDGATFLANRRDAQAGQLACAARRDEFQNRLTEAGVSLRELGRLHGDLTAELESLRGRRSNISSQMLQIRDALCAALHLLPDSLPFIGELIQVREEERAWEGAAERLLHGFGMSLLVPEAHYTAVAAWVDSTNIGNRLVYYRVRSKVEAATSALPANALARKLQIKPDSPFYDWIDGELGRRFDHACCDKLEEFRRARRAVTRNGQTKGAGERHEKDDRHRLDDRSRYVLGWSNQAKIAALAKQERNLATRIQGNGAIIAGLKVELAQQEELLRQWQQLSVFDNFDDLDWKPLVVDIEGLERELAALSASSDLLRTLQSQFQELVQVQTAAEQQFALANSAHARASEKLEQAMRADADCAILLEATPQEAQVHYFPMLESLREQALGAHHLTVESSDNREKDFREFLQAHIDAEDRKIARLRDAVIGAMRDYTRNWPLDAREVDISIDAGGEFKRMLAALQADDLPRFAARFKDLLNENTIREIAGFQSQLKRERETIRERIAKINGSLHAIDYNPNRYIALEAEQNLDADLRDFQQDLRTCTEGALTGTADEAYSEAKFLQVKRIIERFRGREGTAEVDRRWTRKVTDVRNWFVFSASERWREDDREHEHYTDAGGKSGGQKEKLAYTVLAASLAYQFGLEWGAVRSRSFRFVVIDEAFGRGSDESARFGLELFKRMNLQLLIVTPLQKIHIIEPYVSGLGFVHSEEGRQSRLRYLSIAEYHAERDARTA